jgi:hypothetical protein
MGSTCAECDEPLPERASTGRQAIYCSQSCKRLAEFRVRRLTRRLEVVETRLSDAHIVATSRTHLASEHPGLAAFDQREIDALSGEVAELEQRLRTLIEA